MIEGKDGQNNFSVQPNWRVPPQSKESKKERAVIFSFILACEAMSSQHLCIIVVVSGKMLHMYCFQICSLWFHKCIGGNPSGTKQLSSVTAAGIHIVHNVVTFQGMCRSVICNQSPIMMRRILTCTCCISNVTFFTCESQSKCLEFASVTLNYIWLSASILHNLVIDFSFTKTQTCHLV